MKFVSTRSLLASGFTASALFLSAVDCLSFDINSSITNINHRLGQRNMFNGEISLLPMWSVQTASSESNGRMFGLLCEILSFRWHHDERKFHSSRLFERLFSQSSVEDRCLLSTCGRLEHQFRTLLHVRQRDVQSSFSGLHFSVTSSRQPVRSATDPMAKDILTERFPSHRFIFSLSICVCACVSLCWNRCVAKIDNDGRVSTHPGWQSRRTGKVHVFPCSGSTTKTCSSFNYSSQCQNGSSTWEHFVAARVSCRKDLSFWCRSLR